MARTVTIGSLPEAFAAIKEMRGQDCEWGEDDRAAGRLARRWQDLYPKAVACLRTDLDELLACFAFEDPSRRKAARTSIETILFAVFTYENHNQGVSAPYPADTKLVTLPRKPRNIGKTPGTRAWLAR